MSDDIFDVEKWKKEYPFLDKVWDTYMEFDNSVAHDNNAHSYNAFCHSIIDQSDENKEENKKFCSKLVRNLGCYATDTKFFNPSTERCHMTQMRQKPKCYYYHYEDNYNDPMKMIILEIFQYNMKDVNDIVAMEYKQPDFRVQKYICECVKIYKEMNRENCAKSNAANVKSNRTCEKLKTFKKTYENYLFATPHKNYNIPSLDKVEDDYLTMCQTDAPKLALAGQMAEAGSVLQPTTEYRDGKKDEFSPPSLTTDENKGSSMSRTVSTAFGTVAGASSILALLYKFTPGRNWMRSGIRGSGGRISNNLYSEQANELFYDGFEGEVMSSHNPTYNVGYRSA